MSNVIRIYSHIGWIIYIMDNKKYIIHNIKSIVTYEFSQNVLIYLRYLTVYHMLLYYKHYE